MTPKSHDMAKALDRVEWPGSGDGYLGRRTISLLLQAQEFSGIKVRLVQGGWSTSVPESYNTHARDGVFDVQPLNGSYADMIRWHRLCGLWTWHRLPSQGNWPEHAHGIDLGNPNLAPTAQKQSQDAYAGLNGLATHLRDAEFRPSYGPIKGLWPLRYVDLSNVVEEARKRRNWQKRPSVSRIQRALNVKSGTYLLVDGIYGPKTKAAVARWEVQNGGDGDGIPAIHAMRLLGAGRFNIKE